MAAAAAVIGCLTNARKLSVAELPVPTASVFADLIASLEIARPAPAGKLTKSASAVSSDASACDPTKQFTKLHGIAAKLDIQSIDTDMIISARFLKTMKRSGLGVSAFSALRYNSDGSETPDLILNQPTCKESSILVSGDDLGADPAGSTLLGRWVIRSVISTSFADIFFSYCFKNGMLLAVVSLENLDALMADADARKTLDIDLETQSINRADGSKVTFEIGAFRTHCLLNGLDDIGLTMQKSDKIASFEKTRSTVSPWLDNASQSYLTAVWTVGRGTAVPFFYLSRYLNNLRFLAPQFHSRIFL
jgi:3-isopropylmalate dehydratase small subunit